MACSACLHCMQMQIQIASGAYNNIMKALSVKARESGQDTKLNAFPALFVCYQGLIGQEWLVELLGFTRSILVLPFRPLQAVFLYLPLLIKLKFVSRENSRRMRARIAEISRRYLLLLFLFLNIGLVQLITFIRKLASQKACRTLVIKRVKVR